MSGKTVEAKVYYKVYLALMMLLVITLGSAYVNLGPLNPIVNILIALIKATLVGLFFMHVHYDKPLLKVFAISGFFWLMILLTLGMSDYVSRGWTRLPGAWPQKEFPQPPKSAP
jgi:cytochrome c oxidase subunit 4